MSILSIFLDVVGVGSCVRSYVCDHTALDAERAYLNARVSELERDKGKLTAALKECEKVAEAEHLTVVRLGDDNARLIAIVGVHEETNRSLQKQLKFYELAESAGSPGTSLLAATSTEQPKKKRTKRKA